MSKYAQISFQVDLNKPLLAMFSIKGRHYKVEYGGLYLLCICCERFEHHAKVYGEKKAFTMVDDGEEE